MSESIMTLRPPDLNLNDVIGVDILISMDNRIPLNQEMLLAIRQDAIDYLHSIFTPIEVCGFYENTMWWNIPYAISRLGFVPEEFQIYEQKVFLNYSATSVLEQFVGKPI